jgi:hemerythrin-like domain-containing protein
MDSIPNVGNDLVRIHKVITRALGVAMQNSQGANLEETQRQGFASYVRAMTILLHAHHSGEDELAFPFWKTRLPDGPFEELGRQHGEMVGFLERIERWLKSGAQAWQTSAMGGLHKELSDLSAHWGIHIALEEATVGPENSVKYLTPTENGQLAQQLAEHERAHSQPSELVMPFVVFNLEAEDRSEFVALLPQVMTQQLIPVVWKAVWEPMRPFLLE